MLRWERGLEICLFQYLSTRFGTQPASSRVIMCCQVTAMASSLPFKANNVHDVYLTHVCHKCCSSFLVCNLHLSFLTSYINIHNQIILSSCAVHDTIHPFCQGPLAPLRNGHFRSPHKHCSTLSAIAQCHIAACVLYPLTGEPQLSQI